MFPMAFRIPLFYGSSVVHIILFLHYSQMESRPLDLALCYLLNHRATFVMHDLKDKTTIYNLRYDNLLYDTVYVRKSLEN